MPKLEKFARQVQEKGYDTSFSELKNLSDGRLSAPVLIVKHNYDGMYPTKEVLSIHQDVSALASKAGLECKARGHYTASFVYEKR